jgi:hypothetical protein
MESILTFLAFSSLGLSILSSVGILVSRSIIAAKFLSEEEFETFQEKGFSNHFGTFPTGFSWENRFLRSVLARSDHPSAPRHALIWRLCFGTWILSALLLLVFLLTSIAINALGLLE